MWVIHSWGSKVPVSSNNFWWGDPRNLQGKQPWAQSQVLTFGSLQTRGRRTNGCHFIYCHQRRKTEKETRFHFILQTEIYILKSVCLCWRLFSINVWSEISLNHTHGALLHNSKKEDNWGSLKLKLGFTTAQKFLKSHLTFTIRCPLCPRWLNNTSHENAFNPRRKVFTQRPEAWQLRAAFQKDRVSCLWYFWE